MEDDGDVRGQRIAAQAAADFETVHVREVHVEEHGVDRMRLRVFDTVSACRTLVALNPASSSNSASPSEWAWLSSMTKTLIAALSEDAVSSSIVGFTDYKHTLCMTQLKNMTGGTLTLSG
jgi:hypothetical protein